MKRRTRTRHRPYMIPVKVVTVARKPLKVEAYVTPEGRLGFLAHSGDDAWPIGVEMRRLLTRAETNRFFARLADVLGYEVTRPRRTVRPAPAWIRTPTPLRRRKSKIVAKRRRSGRKARGFVLGMRVPGDQNAMARVYVEVSRAALLRLCREIAEHVGWELTEAA